MILHLRRLLSTLLAHWASAQLRSELTYWRDAAEMRRQEFLAMQRAFHQEQLVIDDLKRQIRSSREAPQGPR